MLSVFTFTEAGGHAVNEDALEIQRHPANGDCWFGTLADGQGGQPRGGPAARLACRTVLDSAARLSPDRLRHSATWVGLLESADAAVAADPNSGFTTLIGYCVSDQGIWGASSGDSALWIVDKSRRLADLTKHQIKNPPVGSGGAVIVPFAMNLTDFKIVLAMSDGVWKYVGWDRIAETIALLRGQALVEALAGMARLTGSQRFQDDFTLVVIQNDVSI